MHRNAKRKAAANHSNTESDRATKRIKSEHEDASKNKPNENETPDSTTEAGLRFIEHIKKSVDKHNRPIATAFLTLPDKRDLPDYYDVIALPISIETIQNKLEARQYSNLSELESDVKRMERNAKEYNETGSEVYLDAERIRKATLNWMIKANPAHKKNGYTVVPTPIPPDREKRLTLTLKNGTAKKDDSANHDKKGKHDATRADAEPESKLQPEDDTQQNTGDNEENPFSGKNFQEAQEQIISDCLEHTDEGSDVQIFTPFADLPSRSLTDYYAVIKNPISLKGIRKRIRGIHGRAAPSGITDYQSWDSFENEVRKIWENAREYNEDESDMYRLANEFQEFFEQRLALAKKTVNEPPQPTIKLKMGTKPTTSLKLRLGNGSQKASPGPATSPTLKSPPASSVPASGTGDRPTSSNGQDPAQINGTNQQHESATPALPKTSSTAAGSPPASVNGAKSDSSKQDASTSRNSMIPASNVLTNGLPNGNSQGNKTSTTSPRPMTATAPSVPHVPYYTPPTGFQSKWRPKGKDASTALLNRINLFSRSPQADLDPIGLFVLPNSQLSQQSITFAIPSSHTVLQLEPQLSASLAVPSNRGGRPYKMFISCNGTRVTPARQPLGVTKSPPDLDKLIFEMRLNIGMNRIEIEVVTDSEVPSEGLELERCNIFANVMR